MDAETQANILIVDDDAEIRDLLAEHLSSRGYRTLTCENAGEMEGALSRERVDLILLDVMMPGEDGLSACHRLTESGGPPIVMLSALAGEYDRVKGLEIGASHYLSKPCSAREVVATVQAALRSRGAISQMPRVGYIFDGWRIDVAAHELIDSDGVLVLLPPKGLTGPRRFAR